jgi:hypothetical protein
MMRTRIGHGFIAAAAAAATVTTVGLTSAAAADAAAAPGAAAIRTAYSNSFAGYIAGGAWRFRYVATSLPMAACQAPPGNNAEATIALRGPHNEVAHIDLTCGGGFGSVRFGAEEHASGVFHLSPGVGNVLRVSIFRDQATGRDTFTATNTATGRTEKVAVHTPRADIYGQAQLGAFIDNANVTPPPASVRLWVFRNSDITSYNATHGTLVGPWPTFKVTATTTGTSSGTVVMYPTYPSNSGHNFGVWLKGTG